MREKRAEKQSFEMRFASELGRVNQNLGACFADDPDASGRIQFKLVLDDEGTSAETSIVANDLPEPVATCMLEAMRGMRGVAPPNGRLEIPLPPFAFEKGRDVSSKM